MHRCQRHCSGKDSDITSALPLSGAVVLVQGAAEMNMCCSLSWHKPSPEGLELVLQSQMCRGDTRPALPCPYKDNLRQRWESCCKVTGLSCQSPNPALGLRTTQEMKCHPEKPPVRQAGTGHTTLSNQHGFPTTVASVTYFL